MKISKFSELEIDNEKVQSVTIIQDPIEIKELGYSRFNSIVKIKTEEEKDYGEMKETDGNNKK